MLSLFPLKGGLTPALAVALLSTSALAAQDRPKGGTFRVGLPIFTICYDASQTPFVPFVHHAVVDNLLEQSRTSGEILPWLAKSWKIEDAGATYVLTLRDDVTFSNGERFDANTVKTNFDNHIPMGKLGKSPQASAYLSGYLSTDIIDDITVAIKFDRPKAGFLQALTEKPLGIIAPETINSKTPEQRCAEGVTGSGAFVIDSIIPDQEAVLVTRKDYNWNSPNQEGKGRANVDRLVFKLVPESAVRVGSLLSGQLEAIQTVPALDIDRVEKSGAEIVSARSAGSVYSFFFNYNKPITADPAVRQALQTGIDCAELIEVAYTKFDKPATGVLSTTVSQYIDLSEKLSYDPDRSKTVLEQAGWIAGADGIREKDGKRLTLQFKYTEEADKVPLELLQQPLRLIGIDFKIAQVTRAELTEWEAPNKNWDIIAANLTRPDADILLSRFHPKFSWWLGGQELDPYPEITALLEKQTIEVDAAKRSKLAAEIQTLLVDGAYTVPVREVSYTWG